MATTTLSTEQRFFNSVHKSDDPDGCWLWTGGKFSTGYGRFTVEKKRVLAHRWAYEHFTGKIPGGLLVCHRCDNPACVNPAHLFIGTHKDNSQDMVQKRRAVYQRHPEKARRGEKHLNAKLTADKVREIRRRYALGGISQSRLAQEFSVSTRSISYIVTRQHWQHID